jgi:hypothetical protein
MFFQSVPSSPAPPAGRRARAGSSRSECPAWEPPRRRFTWGGLKRVTFRCAVQFLRRLSRDCRHLEGTCRIKAATLDVPRASARAQRAENRVETLRGRRNCGMGDEVDARGDRTRAEMSSTGLRVCTIRG